MIALYVNYKIKLFLPLVLWSSMNSVPSPPERTSSGPRPCTSARKGPLRPGWMFGSVGDCTKNFAILDHLRTSGTPWLVGASFLALALKTPSTPTHWIHLKSGCWYSWNPVEIRDVNGGEIIVSVNLNLCFVTQFTLPVENLCCNSPILFETFMAVSVTSN